MSLGWIWQQSLIRNQRAYVFALEFLNLSSRAERISEPIFTPVSHKNKRTDFMNAINKNLIEVRHTADLVRAAQAGNRDAFGDLFERFQPTVMAIAMRRLRDHADAQELCQDVFVQAMLKIEQLRTPEAFIGWLRQITVRMAINRAVRRAPAVSVEPEMLEATVVGSESPLNAILEVERKGQVRAGLERLGEMDRDTLVSFYVEGNSLLEMADDFDAPLGTIKRRLHVARKRLATQVEDLAAVG
ncbi:MAG: sigma-70 family RNA polymerase sigma factor [Mariniblastus sp.]|nr:sigma-70 family RNA polymerase sigma factor [Mariniblastus sp.]